MLPYAAPRTTAEPALLVRERHQAFSWCLDRGLAAGKSRTVHPGEGVAPKSDFERAHGARRHGRALLQQGGIRTDTTGILGALVYWLVILAAWIIAFNGLGPDLHHRPAAARCVLFVPHVVVALLILAFGAYFARFIAGSP